MCISSLIQKFDARSRLTAFACLEIHVAPSQGEGPALYRVFSQHGTLERKDSKVRMERGVRENDIARVPAHCIGQERMQFSHCISNTRS